MWWRVVEGAWLGQSITILRLRPSQYCPIRKLYHHEFHLVPSLIPTSLQLIALRRAREVVWVTHSCVRFNRL